MYILIQKSKNHVILKLLDGSLTRYTHTKSIGQKMYIQ